jgi:hypothetical protein
MTQKELIIKTYKKGLNDGIMIISIPIIFIIIIAIILN